MLVTARNYKTEVLYSDYSISKRNNKQKFSYGLNIVMLIFYDIHVTGVNLINNMEVPVSDPCFSTIKTLWDLPNKLQMYFLEVSVLD